MSDLIEFLRARLDEDEQVAQDAAPGPWFLFPSPFGYSNVDVYTAPATARLGKGVAADHEGFGACGKAEAEHIARHDPARVLWEVEAKRRLIEAYEVACARCDNPGPADPAHLTTRRLALGEAVVYAAMPYADHADYDESWRP